MNCRILLRSAAQLSAGLVVMLLVPLARGHDGAHSHFASSPIDVRRTATGIRYFEARLAANPDDLIALSKLGALRLKMARRSGTHEEYAAAEQAFRDLLDRGGDPANAHIGLAYALAGRHRFSKALESARSAAATMHESSAVWALLGDLHFALGNYAEAEMAYARLLADGLTLQSLSRMAQIYELRGRYDEAVRLMNDALEAGRLLDEPPSALAWCETMLGDMELNRERLDAAEGHYRAALKLDSGAHAAWWRIADIAIRRGQSVEAENRLRDLVRVAPLPQYLIALGEALFSQGKLSEAEAWHAKAEAELVGDWERGEWGHVRELVEFWLASDRNLDRAVELALRDLHDVRHDRGAFETAAWAQFKAGRTNEAAALIRFALRPGPGSARLASRAAEILAAAERDRSARRLEEVALNRRARPNETNKSGRSAADSPGS